MWVSAFQEAGVAHPHMHKIKQPRKREASVGHAQRRNGDT
jgi:hypothetical protein